MILHLDLDCFFAAAHRIDSPELHNIPIAVGSRSNLSIFDTTTQKRQLSKIEGAFTSSIISADNHNKSFEEYFVDIDKNKNKKIRGIITTSSYEARAYGVKTAMSVDEALRLCPALKVLAPNYPLYHELSHKLKLLLEKQIPTIEQFSIDEFFGDVAGWVKGEDVYDFAQNLKQQIQDQLGLPISIGIAKTKWIAKLATNDAKPNGVKFINPKRVQSYIQHKQIKEFCGIGKQYQDRLKSKGIKTLGDVKDNKELFSSWGKFGTQLYHRILGTDNEHIVAKKDPSKSIGLGRTFDPLYDREEAKRRIVILCRHLSFLAHKNRYNPLTFSLNFKYEYGIKAKDHINTNRNFSELILKQELTKLFDKIDKHPSYAIVQINITLSNFQENKHNTLNIFTLEDDKKQVKITDAMHKLRDKFGIDIVKSATELAKSK
jgi:DNA polymerase-4